MAKAKRVDPIKQREKRAKIAAAVGGALFLVVAAIEVPPVLKSNSPPPAHASTSSSSTTPTTTTSSSSTSSSTAAAPAPAAGELADTDAPPPVEPGELVSFSMFQSKNPFAPQVTEGTTATATPAATTPAPTTAGKQGAGASGSPTSTLPTTTTPAAGTPPTTTVPAGSTGVVPSASTPPAAATAPAVAISVNGSVSHVAADGTFPDASPVFRLVSFAKDTAQIGIVGGSYAAGGATLTLHLHTPVTLENQTDGKRYTLELDSTP